MLADREETNLVADIVERARLREYPEVLVLVAGDESLLRIAAVWGLAGITARRGPLIAVPHSPDAPEALAWLWERTVVSVGVIARASGLTEGQIQRRLPLLQVNQIVYPDGTIHALVRRLLQQRVLRQFEQTERRRRTSDS